MSPKISSERAPSGAKSGRRRAGHAQEDHIIDPYKQVAKLSEPTVCAQCGAVYEHGRWRWATRPESAEASLCQACRRINDNFPAGIVTLTGQAIAGHKDEMIRLIRNQEQAEKTEHPLNRIMAIDDKTPGRIEITTTDIHLPRRIGDAIRRAYKGDLAEQFDEGNYFVRVNWHRDA